MTISSSIVKRSIHLSSNNNDIKVYASIIKRYSQQVMCASNCSSLSKNKNLTPSRKINQMKTTTSTQTNQRSLYTHWQRYSTPKRCEFELILTGCNLMPWQILDLSIISSTKGLLKQGLVMKVTIVNENKLVSQRVCKQLKVVLHNTHFFIDFFSHASQFRHRSQGLMAPNIGFNSLKFQDYKDTILSPRSNH